MKYSWKGQKDRNRYKNRIYEGTILLWSSSRRHLARWSTCKQQLAYWHDPRKQGRFSSEQPTLWQGQRSRFFPLACRLEDFSVLSIRRRLGVIMLWNLRCQCRLCLGPRWGSGHWFCPVTFFDDSWVNCISTSVPYLCIDTSSNRSKLAIYFSFLRMVGFVLTL